MPIHLTPIPMNDVMHGFVWTLADEKKLASSWRRYFLGTIYMWSGYFPAEPRKGSLLSMELRKMQSWGPQL
jgi:hypothetical protein